MVHFIPSKTENLTICSGEIWFVIVREKAFSLLSIVSSVEPLLKSGFTHADKVNWETSSIESITLVV